LKYLAPYVYRAAITNNRIETLESGQVTYRFKNSRTDHWESKTLPVFDFMHRFLQHVLPKGFMKIRYYGLMAPARKHLWAVALYLLGVTEQPAVLKPVAVKHHVCPHCGSPLRWIKPLGKSTRAPP
jgi:hypothetical protein